MENERKYWLALALNYKIGSRTLLKIVKHYKTIQNAWHKSKKQLLEKGFSENQANEIIVSIENADFIKNEKLIDKYGVNYITFLDQEYPDSLKEIPDPPGILFYKGNIDLLKTQCLAVVGSRLFTQYGERSANIIVTQLANAGLTIVSGLALGIDTLVHVATLQANGKTIAVLGNGLDTIYPSNNLRLAEKIIQNNGLIISEYAIGQPAFRSNFPLRNRIIAGLSLGTLVVEAAEDSGSLITARASIEYNREVFAVPGSIFTDQAKGPNKLIKMGAKLTENAGDILSELNLSNIKYNLEIQKIVPDNQEEAKILEILKEPTAVDELIKTSSLTPTLVNTTLIMLEMKGKIRNLGGTIYIINGKL